MTRAPIVAILAAAVLSGAAVPVVALPPGPKVDCSLPGIDDRCEEWVRTLDFPGPAGYGYEDAVDGVVAGDRFVVVGTTGEDELVGPFDIVVAAYGRDGTKAWQDRFDGPHAAHDYPTDAVASPDGTRVYVVGGHDERATPEGYGNSNFGTIAYDLATGTRRWVATYDSADVNGKYGAGRATAVAVSPDGSTVYVVGQSTGPGTNWDIALLAYRASDGAELWRTRYNRDADIEIPMAVAAGPDGGVYVTGWTLRGSTLETVTMAFEGRDPERLGSVRWFQRREGGGNAPRAMALAPDGSRLYVLAIDGGAAATIAYDTATGAEGWIHRYLPAQSWVDPRSIVVSPDGTRVFTTGTTARLHNVLLTNLRDMDFGTVAIDAATGGHLWEARYGFPGATEEEAFGLAVHPDGRTVFVTGYSSEATYTYWPVVATVAYDAGTGGQRWVARHRRTGATMDHDEPVAAAVTNDGRRLMVAGRFTYRPDLTNSEIATSDLAVLAYDACTSVCPLEVDR